jgi:galactose mutarotase-like enzyme
METALYTEMASSGNNHYYGCAVSYDFANNVANDEYHIEDTKNKQTPNWKI